MNDGKHGSVSTPAAQGPRSDSPFLSYSTLGWMVTVMFWGPIWLAAMAIRMMSSSDQNPGERR